MKITQSRSLRALIFASVALFAHTASAFDGPIAVAKVTVMEATYLPGFFFFAVDQQVANCAPGEWLMWDGGAQYPPATSSGIDRKANVKAISNVVLAALHASGRLRVHARNKPVNGNCTVEFIHALPAQ